MWLGFMVYVAGVHGVCGWGSWCMWLGFMTPQRQQLGGTSAPISLRLGFDTLQYVQRQEV